MAAHLLHFIVLEYCISIKFQSVGIFSDNTPTVAWASKLSSKSLLAGRLLRALAIRQYVAQSSPVVTAHIKGSSNIRADNASRWFDNRHNKHDKKLSNLAFLPFFNSTHKLQQGSWVEFRVSSALSLKMTNELRGKPSTLASWIRTPLRGGNIGGVGCNTPATWVSALTYKDKAMTQLLHCSASQRGSDQEPMEKAKELAFRASQTRWAPSQRLSKWEDTIVLHTDIIKHTSKTRSTPNSSTSFSGLYSWTTFWKGVPSKSYAYSNRNRSPRPHRFLLHAASRRIHRAYFKWRRQGQSNKNSSVYCQRCNVLEKRGSNEELEEIPQRRWSYTTSDEPKEW